MMALVVGAVLPYLIDEAGINYSIVGGLLSAFAIGNLLVSFVNPLVASKVGQKFTAVVLSLLIPLSLFVITLLPPVGVLYIALNLLHTVFAVGAFLAPFLTSLYIKNGFN